MRKHSVWHRSNPLGIGRRLSSKTSSIRTGFRLPRSKAKSKTGSKTATKVKKSKFPAMTDGPISVTYGLLPYKREAKIPKGVYASTGMQTMIADRIQYQTWAQGQQKAISGASFFPYEDLVSIFAGSSALKNPNVNLNQKVFLLGCKSKMMITNQTSDVINVTLYDCIARTSGTSTTFYSPETCWTQGATDANGLSAVVNRPGSTPFSTPGFTENWWVARTSKVIIGTGGHHEHRYNVKVNQILSKEMTLKYNSAYATYAKLTAYTMIVVHGYPCNETGGTTVTTAGGKIDIVQTKEYAYRIFDEAASSIQAQTTNLVINATQSILNDATGTVSTIATA